MSLGSIIGGRFRLDALAGSGGMGAVYRALDLETNEPVAVKLLHPHAFSEATRLAREAEALALLSHPAIVRYIAHASLDEGLPYLAMEWLEGEDLHARLDRGPLPLHEAITLVTRAADAVAAAHGRGLVHRDIKPTNLFLVGGRPEQVKVLDFGIVRWQSRALTRTGVAFGTPGYMSPEQAAGSRTADARADVFSLGCVLFEALTARPAFEGDNVMAVLAKLMLQDAPTLAEFMPDAPEALQDLVARTLAKDPAERPPDAAALVSELTLLDIRPRPTSIAPSTRRRAITEGEQRIVSVVIAHEGRSVSDAPYEALRAAVWPHAERLELLVDGSIVVVPETAGSPTDQANQAARCALAIRGRLPGWSVAIVTGRGEVTERRVLGEAIDRAARLLDARDGVTIDEDTAALLDARFDVVTTENGSLLVAERPFVDVRRTVLGKQTPCVGREGDIAALASYFDDCIAERRSRAILVTGPPGIGKSRLKNELVQVIHARCPAAEVWTARGDPVSVGSPFGMLAGALRAAAGLPEGTPEDVARDRLAARVALHVDTTERHRVTEFLGELVGAPFPDDVALHAARQDAALMGDQIQRAVSDLMAAECAKHPLLVVFEDLHWGDVPSVRVIDAALRTLRDRPLMVLAFARPEVGELFPKLWQGRGLVELPLTELGASAGRELVRAVLGDSVAEEEVLRLVDLSGGNPFYLEELIRAAAGGRTEGPAPTTVLGMVQARLDDLAPDRRRWLRAASVFGVAFWVGGVNALLGGNVPRLAELLGELVERELIRRDHDSRFAGQFEYSFHHALVRDAAYAMLTDADRPLAHRLAGEWLRKSGEHDVVVLAEHFEAGGALERAAEYYERAAAHALEGNDLASVLARTERARACGASGEILVRARLLEARVHQWRLEMPRVLESAEDAIDNAVAGTAPWFDAIGIIAPALQGAGLHERTEELALLLDDVPADPAARPAWAKACARIGVHLSFSDRIDLARKLLARLEDEGASALADETARARFLEFRAHLERDMGNVAAYPLRMPDVAEAFERVGDLRSALVARVNVVFGYLELGDYEMVETTARRALDAAAAMGLTLAVQAAGHCLGSALLALGRPREAFDHLSEAATGFAEGGYARLAGAARIALADLHLVEGDLDAAARSAERAVELLEENPPFFALALATRARVRLAQGRVREASSDAMEAMAPLQLGGRAVEGTARIRLVHAEVLRASGSIELASSAIAEARDALLAQSDRMPNAGWRATFLVNVRDNARTLELARAWLS